MKIAIIGTNNDDSDLPFWRGFAIRASQYRRHGLQIRASEKCCFLIFNF